MCEDSVQIASLFVPESHDREKGLAERRRHPYHSSSGAPPLVQWLLSSPSAGGDRASKGGQLSLPA